MILSGGMTSRLFHNIREKYGYVYEIYSFSDLFLNEGLFGVYAGIDGKRLDSMKEKIYRE
jgi:predicted Zn-dependent peptidase